MDTVNKENSLPHDKPSLEPPTLIEYMLDFGHVLQGSKKTLQQVIVNTTKQPMIWLVDFGETGWLTLQPDHGILQPGEQQSIRVTADTSRLEIGGYSVRLTFSSEGDETSMSTNTMTRVMVEAPLKPVATRPLEAGLDFGGLTPQSSSTLGLVISNPDDREVNWQIQIGTDKLGMGVRETLEHGRRKAGIRENCNITKAKGIILSASKGTLPAHTLNTIYVTVNAAMLKRDYAYSTHLTLISQAPGSAPSSVQVPLVFYISKHPYNDGGPKVPLDWPKSFNLTIPPEQTNGIPSLSFTNAEPTSVGWNLQSDAAWLIPVPASGQLKANEQATVVLTVDRTGLTAGSKTANLFLTLNWVPDTGNVTQAYPPPTSLVVDVQ